MGKRELIIVCVLGVGLVLALLGVDLPLLPDWLVQYTSWLLSALFIVLGPTLAVKASEAVEALRDRPGRADPVVGGAKPL